jgi:hypothetical protein
MAFSITQSMFGTTESSSAIGILVVRIGKGQCYSTKTYTTFNPINLVEVEHILIIQGKDFRVPIGQGQEAFQATTAWYKSRFYISPKTIGF